MISHQRLYWSDAADGTTPSHRTVVLSGNKSNMRNMYQSVVVSVSNYCIVIGRCLHLRSLKSSQCMVKH